MQSGQWNAQGKIWVAGAALGAIAGLVLILICFITQGNQASAATEAAIESAADADAEAADSPDAWSGYTSFTYKHRSTRMSGERDQDLFVHLQLDYVSQPEETSEFHFLGLLRSDLDGDQNRRDFAPFEDIGDTYDSPTVGYLYEAHLDYNYLLSFLRQVRLGRQADTRDQQVYFDGVAADVEASRSFLMTLYGGYAVHFFGLDDDGESDSLGGVGIDLFPRAPTKFSLDYLSVRDKRDTGPELRDRLVSLRLRQRFSNSWSGLAKAGYINGEQRDLKLRTHATFPGAGMAVSAAYFRQFRTQNELSQEFSSFYYVLGQSEPFHSIDLKLRWVFAEDYGLDVGYFQRELMDDADTGPFNRAYNRTFAVFDVQNFIVHRFSATLIAEQWRSGASEFDSTGLELMHKIGNGRRYTRLSGGTYYSLYKYDYYLDLGERTSVRTYFLKAKVPVGNSFWINGGYEQERGEEEYQTLKAGARYDF